MQEKQLHTPLTLTMIRKYCISKVKIQDLIEESKRESNSETTSHAGDTTSISTANHEK